MRLEGLVGSEDGEEEGGDGAIEVCVSARGMFLVHLVVGCRHRGELGAYDKSMGRRSNMIATGRWADDESEAVAAPSCAWRYVMLMRMRKRMEGDQQRRRVVVLSGLSRDGEVERS